MDVLVLSSTDVSELFSVDVAIASQRRAFDHLGRGIAVLPPRLLAEGQEGSTAFCYAARLEVDGPAVSKFGSVNPANAGRGLPTVAALITVLDANTGRPVAIMDGTSVTTLRTSAASAVAVEMLASPQSDSLAVLGAGVQAEAHVAAISRVLGLDSVKVWSPKRHHRDSLVSRLAWAGATETGMTVVSTSTPEEAVRGAGVVVCCTTSHEPVLDADWLRPGATVISIGSYAPDRHEVPQTLVAMAGSVVVDDVDASIEQAGPIVAGVASGILSGDRLIPLGKVVAGLAAGRKNATDIIYYNSIGIGIQDAAASEAVIDAARRRGFGQFLQL
jgi:ornithine cyclodeaminase/alanine dehydrogenase-like protein (mu-crystallin family)